MKQPSIFREFIKYSSFNVLGMIGLSCYILADTFFISKGVGANGLTALNLALPIYSCIHGNGLMLGMGGATKFSILKGQQASGHTDRLFTNTLYLTALFAVFFLTAGIFFSAPLTRLMGADSEVFAMTNTYLSVILLFSPAFLLNEVLLCFVRNDGNPRLSMLAMLGGSLSNILLDYLFIFPLEMGIFGAVLATGFAPLISMLLLSRHWWKKQNTFHFKKAKPDFTLVPPILSLGFPSFLAEIASGIVIIVYNAILLKIQGNVAVAAYGVIANLSLVVAAVYTGIAQGVQPLLSRAYGCFDPVKIRQLLRYTLRTVFAVSILIYLAVFWFAGPITSVFNSEQNVQLQEIATAGLKLYFTSALFMGTNIVISIFFTSTDRALPAHILSLLRGLIVLVPMALLFSYLAGIQGVWLSFPATEGLVTLLGLLLLKQETLRK
ncbi:MATE family efflux transporter [Cuneatibacter sp. NSJ-177]|uniref:MATE family efflux transporter n=1 Tax=Cuneatibacter sp. NSJ-177 TaxID=2931401 RepID=UPI001FD56DCB|nr:MATE family efflux transporter [Cuneatibacter sp. NSJ-177]MCJ7835964.1 MATE family efflux transporter [Cuneatibacter sp. NSJ-177]